MRIPVSSELGCDMINILVCKKVKEHPQRHSYSVKVSKNDVIIQLWNITLIYKTLIRKLVQGDLSFNKHGY